jgi:ribokinase
MSRFFVAGLINIETTAAINGFPLDYFPVRYPFFGVESTVSGVGYNVARALHTLGNTVDLASLVGRDALAGLVTGALQADGLPDGLILPELEATPQSVILYDPQGRRQIHVDLKDIQDRRYDPAAAAPAIQASDLAVICNINFARPLLTTAREAGRWIATDVHALSDPEDDYNRDYLQKADILFLSDEALPCPPEDMARDLMSRYGTEIIVVGLGARGALLAVRRDDVVGRFPAVGLRPVVNTIGAGDALFSAFLHGYTQGRDPYRALRGAILFAGYKIGEKGAASGFLTAPELETQIQRWEQQNDRTTQS